MAENYYDLLGVSEDASTAEIEDAYREEIKQVHPDVSDDVDASERTKRLNKAKRILTDDDERGRYDSVGHEAYTSGGPVDADETSGAPRTSSGSGRGRGSSGDSDDGRRYSGGSTGGSYGRGDTGRGSETTSGRANQHGSGSGSAAGSAYRSGSVSGSGDRWPGRTDRRGSGQGRSVGSTGPTWQSAGVGQGSASAAAGADGPSARRQAAAGTTDGPNADWSWNAWEQTRSWAVRQGDAAAGPGFHPLQLVPTQGSFLLFLSTFFLYPFFVSSALFPPFPIVARALIALCTLLMFAYLLSVPETAVAVFGLWGVVTPVALVLLPGVGLFSLAGVIALSATWVPLGIAVLTLSVLET